MRSFCARNDRKSLKSFCVRERTPVRERAHGIFQVFDIKWLFCARVRLRTPPIPPMGVPPALGGAADAPMEIKKQNGRMKVNVKKV